jgi:ABC-type phosphate transport system permease subunit
MIDYDYAPTVFAGIIALVFIVPFIYSLVVDNYDKQTPQIIADKANK